MTSSNFKAPLAREIWKKIPKVSKVTIFTATITEKLLFDPEDGIAVERGWYRWNAKKMHFPTVPRTLPCETPFNLKLPFIYVFLPV